MKSNLFILFQRQKKDQKMADTVELQEVSNIKLFNLNENK